MTDSTVDRPAVGAAPLEPAAARRRTSRYSRSELAVGAAFLLPSLAVFAVFIFYPLWRTFYLSTHGTDVIGRPGRFIGLENFQDLVASSEFRTVLLVTAAFTLLSTAGSTLIGLALALALRTRLAGVGILRTLFATPFAFSAATASVMFAVCFNPAVGVFNGLLHRVGIGPVEWLTSGRWALVSVVAVTVWMQLGYNVLVLSAGLQSIPEELYEAAQLDGSSGWSTLRHITLPMLGPSTILVVVTSSISALQAFGQIHVLTQGGPRDATNTLVYAMYKSAFAFGSSDFGMAAAQALVLLLVVALVTSLQFGVFGRRVFYR